MNIQSLLATRTKGLASSPIRKLVPLMRKPGMISLGGGYPNPDTFAFQSLDVTYKSGRTDTITETAMDMACQYGPTDCHIPLKPLLQAWHRHKDGIDLAGDQMQVLNGSQEGLHIMAYLFLEPGDAVAVSEPAYPGALGAFRAFSNTFISFPLDAHGTVTTELEKILEDHRSRNLPMPKFIYEVPNGHNPGGVALSLDRRKHLLEIARSFDLLILEDDPYQLVQLDDRPPIPSLQSLDTDNRVVRLDSFSKIFAPGLRIGYASGPAEVIRMFQLYKQGTNLHTSAMVQSLLQSYLTQHEPSDFMDLIRSNCALYRANRDAMVDAAREFLPDNVRFNVPNEGMFIWFEFDRAYDTTRMIDTDSIDLGVLLVPGGAFSATGGLSNCMRASFSMVPPDKIREGMKRLGEMVRRESARHN